jgi:hypothetical protein
VKEAEETVKNCWAKRVCEEAEIAEVRGLRRLTAFWERSIVGVETGKRVWGTREWRGEGEESGRRVGCAGLCK